jgi:hypothetical protein
MRKVFISCARPDELHIEQLVEDLGMLGWETWADAKPRRSDWWAEILEQIVDCDVFLAMISRESMSSVACKSQLEWAYALGKPVLSVAVEPLPKVLPRRLSARHLVDYSEPEQQQHRDRTVLRLALGSLPPAPPPPQPLPEPPPDPLSYLTDLIDLVSQDNLEHNLQWQIILQLENAILSADSEERQSGRDILEQLSSRHDLFADVAQSISRLLSLSDQPAPVPAKPDLESRGRAKATAASDAPRTSSSGHGIFISYRRGNENFFARLLYENLRGHFDSDRVFVDVDSIDLGVDFAEVVDQQLSRCSVMLVIIGKGWTSVAGSDGRPRLEDPSDFVRIEVEKGLSRDGVRVIPIYVDGASPPRASELPAPLAALSRRNGLGISHEAFNSDFDRLLKQLERVISTTPD